MWTLHDAKEAINSMLRKGVQSLIVNLEKLGYLDSTGMSWFLASTKRCSEAGIRLAFHSPSAYVYGIFKLVQMQNLIRICDTPEEALAAVAEK